MIKPEDIKNYITEHKKEYRLWLIQETTKEFYEKILESAQTHLPASNELIGSYMCLGKVTDKMQTHIKEGAPELYAEIKEVLAEAAHHPNQADLDELVASVKKALTK